MFDRTVSPQSLVFALDASLLLMLTALFGNCLLLPPPLESGHIIFELIAVKPLPSKPASVLPMTDSNTALAFLPTLSAPWPQKQVVRAHALSLAQVVPIMMAAVMFSGMRVQRRVPEADPMKMKLKKGNRAKISNIELRHVFAPQLLFLDRGLLGCLDPQSTRNKFPQEKSFCEFISALC